MMKQNKGINTNSSPHNTDEGFYIYGKNGIQNDISNSTINEEGFKQFSSFLLEGHRINGMIETDDSKVILFTTDNIFSSIILFDLVTMVPVYSWDDRVVDYKLEFNIDNYITGQVQRNFKGDLVVAFTDKVLFPKVHNFNNPQTEELRSWRLFPSFRNPKIDLEVLEGGNSEIGSYYVALRYYAEDFTMTSFSPVSSSILLSSDDGTTSSSKTLQITLSELDTAYKFVEIALIQKVEGDTKAFLLPAIPVVVGSVTQFYSGEKSLEIISLEEVLTEQVKYEVAKSIGQLNDSLYLANLEKAPDILDMQQYANLVEVEWVSDLKSVLEPTDDMKTGVQKGMMHGEVYALYIQYLINGVNSIAFAIPGNTPTIGDITSSGVAFIGGLIPTLLPEDDVKTFQVEDTIPYFNLSTKSGGTGVYRNANELYPDDVNFDSTSLGGRNLRNTKVLHHKMPSLRWCRANLYGGNASYGKDKLDLLGLRLKNVIIPDKYKGVITGYRLLYAKRTLDNTTQFGQGLKIHHNTMLPSGSDVTKYTTGHNWIFQSGPPTVVDNSELDYNSFRFHAFDILFNKPGIKPSYMDTQYKLTTKMAKIYNPEDGDKGATVGLWDTIKGIGATVSAAPTMYLNAVHGTKYLKNNAVIDPYENTYMETALVGSTTGPTQALTTVKFTDFSGSTKVIPAAPIYPEAYFVSLCNIKRDVYNNFYTQNLITAGDFVDLGTDGEFWRGDIFLSSYTYHTYGISGAKWDEFIIDSAPENNQLRIVNRIACETVSNLYTRFVKTDNIIHSKWYDNNSLKDYATTQSFSTVYPIDFDQLQDPNDFGYNRGNEGINDLSSTIIYTPYRTYEYRFPFRIQRGGKAKNQNNRSWRTFLALDYYDTQKDRGEIVNIEGMDNRLIIHHENSIFLTQDKTKLESGTLGITLGSGDLFQFEPQEVQSSKLGIGGTGHDLACLKTPIGYVFPDSAKGEIYVLESTKSNTGATSASLSSLTGGLKRFLKEYLVVKGNNCFSESSNSITLGWDDKYGRLLMTVNNKIPVTETPIVNLILSNVNTITAEERIVTYELSTNWTESVAIDDVVFLNGKYLKYKGVNKPVETGYDCLPTKDYCFAPTNLLKTLLSMSPTQGNLKFTWSGESHRGYDLVVEELILGVATTLYTEENYQDKEYLISLDAGPTKTYRFKVRLYCSAGVTTEYSTVTFNLPL